MEQIGNRAIGKANALQTRQVKYSMAGYIDRLSSITDYRQAK